MPTRVFSIGFCTVLAVFALAIPRHAHAQGFISPLLGYDFGGDSGCPNITGCEDKKLNFGVGVGSLGPFIGGEFEFSYAKDFFGKAPNYKSSVMTFMGNLLIGPKIGPVQPYGAGVAPFDPIGHRVPALLQNLDHLRVLATADVRKDDP